ncbi:hypothetical protein [uncultured Rikenella sp.]|uniref:hypothetical protein n=1 Tax=uncultured Rikenella sp. TaxID=368003 RepID=UPI0025DEDE78|nr:hypothetical protein [uncultured Rikenella sp.]
MGTLYNVCKEGSIWSTSVNDSYGVYLGFHVTWFNHSIANPRGYGFQLRCLSE